MPRQLGSGRGMSSTEQRTSKLQRLLVEALRRADELELNIVAAHVSSAIELVDREIVRHSDSSRGNRSGG
jgi:hypothetical protein